MSALSIPRCGRPTAVSSILTATTEWFDVLPPVSGLTGLGLGWRGLGCFDGVAMGVGVGVGATATFLLCPLGVTATISTITAATTTAALPPATTLPRRV